MYHPSWSIEYLYDEICAVSKQRWHFSLHMKHIKIWNVSRICWINIFWKTKQNNAESSIGKYLVKSKRNGFSSSFMQWQVPHATHVYKSTICQILSEILKRHLKLSSLSEIYGKPPLCTPSNTINYNSSNNNKNPNQTSAIYYFSRYWGHQRKLWLYFLY